MSDFQTIDSATLESWLADSNEVALLDLREEGLYGEGHAFFASNIPYSRLELRILSLVPRLDTRVVLAGEPEIDALGGRRLTELGYTNVHLLRGGAAGWRDAGHQLFNSIFVPSKAFAEVVEHEMHTPAIKAAELRRLLDDKADITVLDSRTVEEFERFHVPGAISCPSAELAYRFNDLVPSPETFVVVSCAGRTRGIIGAQALINAGVPNRVAALEGGTQGWKLAGLAVENGRTVVYGPVSDAARNAAEERAADLAERYQVPRIDLAQLQAWQTEPDRTTYLFDVRTPEEYAAGHLPGAISIPGGQLVQSLDAWAATRGARVVLADDAAVRAIVTAHWVRQLGWDAVALQYDAGAVRLERGQAPDRVPVLPENEAISAATAKTLLDQGASALSTDSSAAFRAAHPDGASWLNRSRLHRQLDRIPADRTVLIFGAAPEISRLLALDLARLRPQQKILVVTGDAATWRAANIPVVATPADPPDEARIDFLFWLHDRHTGNAEASRAYLEWEGSLPGRVGTPAAAGYRIGPPSSSHVHLPGASL